MKTLGLFAAIGALLLSQSSAQAQEPSLRLDTGLATPINQPQYDRFAPGGSGTLKVAFDLTPWFDVGPTVGTAQFVPQTQNYPGTSVAGLWAFGAEARVKRSHSVPENENWGSPWLGAGMQYVRTGELNRLGFSVSAGFAGNLDEDRHWWLGPYASYQQVIDGTQFGGNPNLDHTDASIVALGVSLEWDPASDYHRPVPVALKPVVQNLPVQPEIKPAPLPVPPVVHHLRASTNVIVQFDFDSSVLDSTSKENLDTLVEGILHDATLDNESVTTQGMKIDVNGHASSENHPEREPHNQALSEHRAQVVRDYLVAAGVSADMLTVHGFGTSHPVSDNSTEAGRVLNRRVSFEIDITFVQKDGS